MSGENRAALLMLKGVISDMPEADRAVIADCADQLRAIVEAQGDLGVVAFALVSAELGGQE